MAVELKKVKHPINGFNWSGVRTDCHPTSPTWSHGQQTKRKQMFGTLRLAGRWIYFIFPLHRIFNIFSQLFQVLADSHATWECPALHFIRKWLKFSSDLKVKIGPVPLNRPLNFLKILKILWSTGVCFWWLGRSSLIDSSKNVGPEIRRKCGIIFRFERETAQLN